MTSLHELGLKYNTDKATYHGYLEFYDTYITPTKDSIKKVLEIGIKEGASIKMWREWFDENVILEGWDIKNIPEIKNTDLRIVDQTNRKQILENITGIYDIIIDDGRHSKQSIETSFATLFPFCKTYIIEDLHAPWCEKINVDDGKKTIDLLEQLMHTKKWDSEFTLTKQKYYIETFAHIEDIYIRGTRKHPFSMSAIIRNSFYDKIY